MGRGSWWWDSAGCSGELCLYTRCQPPLLYNNTKTPPPAAAEQPADKPAAEPAAGTRPAAPPRSDCAAAIPAPGPRRTPVIWGGRSQAMTLPETPPPLPAAEPGQEPRWGPTPPALDLLFAVPGLQLTLIYPRAAELTSLSAAGDELSGAEPN